MDRLFSFGGIDVVHVLRQLERLLLVQSSFLSIDLLGRFHLVFSKKLLRLTAGRSAFAVITPINLHLPVLPSKLEIEYTVQSRNQTAPDRTISGMNFGRRSTFKT